MFATTRSLIPATAAALLLVCACGGSPATQASHPSPAGDVARTWHQLAQCVRDHGQPEYPDPTVDSAGHANWPPGTQKPPDTAVQACQSIFDRIPPENRGHENNDDPAMLQRFAQCMRQHGVEDWPDPDSQGDFHFPPSLGDNLKTSPRWQQIRAAWNGPCKQYNPSGHISSAAEPGTPKSSTKPPA